MMMSHHHEYESYENGMYNDYNEYRGDGFLRDSDEDTEDASETESMKPFGDEFNEYCSMEVDYRPRDYEIKEQIYRDKLADLRLQLDQLESELHPDFVQGLERIRKTFEDRRFFIQCCFEWQKERIANDYFSEEKAAVQEYNDRRIELKENLIADLEEKKRLFEADTLELAFDTAEPKPTTTRKLRRRPNDPIPMPDRRRRASPAHINYMLDDSEISDDLRLITKYLALSTKSVSREDGRKNRADREERNNQSSSKNNVNNSNDYDSSHITITDGKLFYDKKWFHRGQNIMLDSQADGSKTPALILQIGSNEIFVRKPNEQSKMKVSLADLHAKKFIIQRRS